MKSEKDLHVGTPNIGDRPLFHRYVDEIFDRRWLTNRGELLCEFEQTLSNYLGVKHCIAVCNGTVGLELAIRALELEGEVIVPSMTFIATAHALQRQGIKPIFCDIEKHNYNIAPTEIESLITPATSAILGVHAYGNTCDIDALDNIAQSYHLKLMFDAAHAFGSSHNNIMVGNFGNCEVFSFHATKFFNTCEGGAITTNNDELAAKLRLMLNFGFAAMDQVVAEGTNGKLSEMHAAMGLVNFKSLTSFIEANRNNYHSYQRHLTGIPGIRLMPLESSQKMNYQYIVIEIDQEYPLSRDSLMNKLHKVGIYVRRYFWPGCHRMEPYSTLYPDTAAKLPTTEDVSSRILVLPTGTSISETEIRQIADYIRDEV
jgi:dTDP-4-amino-4,6-dideoxygalactose transaminase